ncbi:MAG: GNAT family N-acetyltransferase [Sphingomonadales bacterium]|nr:GNAT family N-acetyltransferase [Sphingomonadales bacterium]
MAVMQAAFDPLYGEAWTRSQVENALLLGGCRTLLIDQHGAEPAESAPAAGFALLRATLDEEELLLFAIAPRWRRRGLGARLLARALASAAEAGITRMLLEMRRGNEAEHLYRAAGFEPIGLRPNYYRTAKGDRLDAITFERRLD